MQTTRFSLVDVYLCPLTSNAYLLGVTPDTQTIAVRVSGYRPYFYVHDPSIDQDRERVEILARTLSDQII